VHDELSYKSLEPSFDIRSSKEYVDLRESFRLNAGGVVRFVPYEKINSEPMCAGVDFKPNIRAVSDKKNESRTEDGRTVIDLSSKIKPTNIRLPQ
jgi:hypothetical protein